MGKSKSPKLKISFIIKEEDKEDLYKWYCNMIAESIYEKPEFQILLKKALNPCNS